MFPDVPRSPGSPGPVSATEGSISLTRQRSLTMTRARPCRTELVTSSLVTEMGLTRRPVPRREDPAVSAGGVLLDRL